MKRLLPLMILITSALPAMAHPACFHDMGPAGATGAGFLHPFSGFDHLFAMIAVGLWAVQICGRALWLLPCSFLASMLLGSFAGLSGIGIAVLEPGIMASVLLLGAVLGIAWRPPLACAAVFTGVAGLLHGFAHGAEITNGTLPVFFLSGMIAATFLLHAFGVGGGLLLRANRARRFLRVAGFALLAFALNSILRSS